MDDNRWTKANRRKTVIKRTIIKQVVGEDFGPSEENLSFYGGSLAKLKRGDPIWRVSLTTKEGLDKEAVSWQYFTSLEEAEAELQFIPEGMSFGDEIGFPMRFKEFGADFLAPMFGAYDDGFWVHVYEALQGAGVLTEANMTSQMVLDWVGEEHIDWMMGEFGESWSVVAELEYCVAHFPKSSLATLGALIRFFEFCAIEPFSVGYFVRQFEVIYHGVEELAKSASDTRKKAGAGGGQVSGRTRHENLLAFMSEIEMLGDLYPRVSEAVIFSQAYANTAAKRKMPKTKKVIEEYGVTIRSEAPFKARFDAIFRKNA